MKTRKILFLIYICLQLGSLQSQNTAEIDSIRHLLKNTSLDSVKLNLYNALYPYLEVNTQPQLVRLCADSVMFLSQKLNNKEAFYQSHYYYGVLALVESDYASAIDHFNQYLEHHTQKGDSVKVARGLFQASVVYNYLGDYDKSLSLLFRCRTIYRHEKDFFNVARILAITGAALFETKKYEEAIKSCKESYAIFDSLQVKTEKPSPLINLGNIYTQIGEFEKARHYYNKALILLKRTGHLSNEATVLANIAYLFDGRQLYDSAMVYHQKALALRKTLHSKDGLARSLIGVGLGYDRLQKYNLSKQYLFTALPITKEIRSKPMILDIYDLLSSIYAKESDFGKAFEFHQLFKAVNDSILNESSIARINELQIKYESEKKDQQITLLAQQKELQEQKTQRQAILKNAFIGGTILTALLAGLLWYTLRQRLKNQQVLAAKNEEIKEVNFNRQLTDLEMKALQAQINPHFIFNCMNSINQMIKNGNNQNASKYLTKFSKLIRSILENAEDAEVSLKDELAALKAYIQLEALRFKENIDYEVQIQDDLDLENTYLPSMVLQPFVENAILHGLRHKKDVANGKISIVINHEQDQLVCFIEDNGVGREKAFELQNKSILKRKSLGLKITEDRLRLLSKELQKQLVRITDLRDPSGNALGTRVEVNIPIT